MWIASKEMNKRLPLVRNFGLLLMMIRGDKEGVKKGDALEY